MVRVDQSLGSPQVEGLGFTCHDYRQDFGVAGEQSELAGGEFFAGTKQPGFGAITQELIMVDDGDDSGSV